MGADKEVKAAGALVKYDTGTKLEPVVVLQPKPSFPPDHPAAPMNVGVPF